MHENLANILSDKKNQYHKQTSFESFDESKKMELTVKHHNGRSKEKTNIVTAAFFKKTKKILEISASNSKSPLSNKYSLKKLKQVNFTQKFKNRPLENDQNQQIEEMWQRSRIASLEFGLQVIPKEKMMLNDQKKKNIRNCLFTNSPSKSSEKIFKLNHKILGNLFKPSVSSDKNLKLKYYLPTNIFRSIPSIRKEKTKSKQKKLHKLYTSSAENLAVRKNRFFSAQGSTQQSCQSKSRQDKHIRLFPKDIIKFTNSTKQPPKTDRISKQINEIYQLQNFVEKRKLRMLDQKLTKNYDKIINLDIKVQQQRRRIQLQNQIYQRQILKLKRLNIIAELMSKNRLKQKNI